MSTDSAYGLLVWLSFSSVMTWIKLVVGDRSQSWLQSPLQPSTLCYFHLLIDPIRKTWTRSGTKDHCCLISDEKKLLLFFFTLLSASITQYYLPLLFFFHFYLCPFPSSPKHLFLSPFSHSFVLVSPPLPTFSPSFFIYTPVIVFISSAPPFLCICHNPKMPPFLLFNL